jgi:hypothetical protein
MASYLKQECGKAFDAIPLSYSITPCRGCFRRRRSAEDRQRDVLHEIRRLSIQIATAERDLADDKTTLDKLIQIARRQGASWAKIGEALGISAHAAHQRAARKTAGSSSGSVTKKTSK